MWNGQYRERHKPQRVLRTPDFVHQQEAGDHEKRQLREARSGRHAQCQVADPAGDQDQQAEADRIQQRDVPCEISRFREDAEEAVGVGAALTVIAEELVPAARM